MENLNKIKELLEKEELTKEEKEFLRKKYDDLSEIKRKLLNEFPKLIKWNVKVKAFTDSLLLAIDDSERIITTHLNVKEARKLKEALEKFEKIEELDRYTRKIFDKCVRWC